MILKKAKVKKPVVKEKFIQDYFIHVAKLNGYYTYRTNNVKISGGNFMKMKDADKGHPDLIALNKHGETFYVEFKSSVGKLSEFQKFQQKEIESRGGKYVVIASILDVTEFIKIHS